MALAKANKQNSGAHPNRRSLSEEEGLTLLCRSAAVKRIMQEARELAEDESTDYAAAPLDDVSVLGLPVASKAVALTPDHDSPEPV
jgi:hypothetical protein